MIILYLGNLAKDVRERDIERKFDKYGRIRDILVKYGYGFVEYDDPRYTLYSNVEIERYLCR